MSVQIEHKKCKSCGKEAMRIESGTYNNPLNKRWVDADNKQWSGRLCPSCQRDRARVNMRRLRAERKPNDSSDPK